MMFALLIQTIQNDAEYFVSQRLLNEATILYFYNQQYDFAGAVFGQIENSIKIKQMENGTIFKAFSAYSASFVNSDIKNLVLDFAVTFKQLKADISQMRIAPINFVANSTLTNVIIKGSINIESLPTMNVVLSKFLSFSHSNQQIVNCKSELKYNVEGVAWNDVMMSFNQQLYQQSDENTYCDNNNIYD